MESNFDYDTKDIWQKDVDHHVHPWTDFSDFKETGSLVLAEAHGAHIYDSEGNRYLDGIGGLWCVNVGYGRDEIARRWPIRPGAWSTTPPSGRTPRCRQRSWPRR